MSRNKGAQAKPTYALSRAALSALAFLSASICCLTRFLASISSSLSLDWIERRTARSRLDSLLLALRRFFLGLLQFEL